jgi:hypothetical protein
MFELPTFVTTLVVMANRRATLYTPSSAIWGRRWKTHMPNPQEECKQMQKKMRKMQTDDEEKATIDAGEEGN